MIVAANQEKEENEEKTDDRFLKSCVLPFCGGSGGSKAKKWFVRKECPG